MFKPALISTGVAALICSTAFAAQTLSSQLEFYVKQNVGLKQQCDDELKALPSADSASLDEIIKGVKESPRFPSATSDMLTALNTASLPADQTDVHASADILNQAPLCWNPNSLALQLKGSKRVIDAGSKEQKEEFTAAFVGRLRTENKKQLLLLPVMIYLQTLDQLAKANLLNSTVRNEIDPAYESAKKLSAKLHDQFPETSDSRDDKRSLEIRKAELSSTREIQARIDSILKKI